MSLFEDTADSVYLRLAGTGRWCYNPRTQHMALDALAAKLLGTNESQIAISAIENLDTNLRTALQAAFNEASHATDPIVHTLTRADDHRRLKLQGEVQRGDQEDTTTIVGIITECPSAPDEDAALLRKIIDAIPYPVSYYTRDGQFGFANRTFYSATGIDPQTSTDRSAASILGDSEADNGEEAFLTCLGGRRTSRYGETALPNRPTYYCRYDYEPVYGALQDDVVGVCTTVFDLTAIKKAEDSLKHTAADLERSNRDLEQFAYVASHDLKAPLRSIEVVLGWLAEDLSDDPRDDIHENLALLRQRAGRLGKLLDDLLAYSRAGRKVGEQSEVDCEELVNEIWSMQAPPESLRFEVTSPLPTLQTYGAPLELVLRNLIGNAIKHHPGPTGLIQISAQALPDRHIFCISDDGDGIPADYAERIFQMFQTLKPRDELEGSGMGLAIVNRTVEWQGGRVWLESPASGGAAFKFEWFIDRPDFSSQPGGAPAQGRDAA